MNNDFKILFVMPVLRTPTYTRLAYESFMENTDGRHKLVICLDLDNAADREYYETHNIPYKVRQGWGHWMMTNWEVWNTMQTSAPYNFVGLLHNDMVFGCGWLDGLEMYFEKQVELVKYKDIIFSFNHVPAPMTPTPEIGKEIFRYSQFIRNTHMNDIPAAVSYLQFLPWVWSFDFHQYNEHCQWLFGGDYGIFKPYRDGRKMNYIPIQFTNSGVVHFGNVACTFHKADFMRIQTTKSFFPELAKDKDYVAIAEFLVNNTIHRESTALREILSLRG